LNDVPHELTHVVFHQNEDSAAIQETYFTFFPLWLGEGLAASDETTDTYSSTLYSTIGARPLIDIVRTFTNDNPSDSNEGLIFGRHPLDRQVRA
jgi:hypothetical protein